MIQDLADINEDVKFNGVTHRYIQWMWFIKISSYTPAKDLRKLVDKNFTTATDFVELISHVYKEASETIHHPLEPLPFEDIKRGLKLHGMDTERMVKAIDVLAKLKQPRSVSYTHLTLPTIYSV